MKQKTERKPNEVLNLARWYVETIEGRTFDYRLDKKYLAQAKRLLNPDPDPETGEVPQKFTVEEIKGCLLALQDGTHPGLKTKLRQVTLNTLTWGEPPYLLQWVAVPEMPAVYEQFSYDGWIREWGRRALEQKKWDGIYRGWTAQRQPDSEGVFSFTELEEIVGWEKADEALRGFYELSKMWNKDERNRGME